jgi:hypothetical protein
LEKQPQIVKIMPINVTGYNFPCKRSIPWWFGVASDPAAIHYFKQPVTAAQSRKNTCKQGFGVVNC